MRVITDTYDALEISQEKYSIGNSPAKNNLMYLLSNKPH